MGNVTYITSNASKTNFIMEVLPLLSVFLNSRS